MEEKKLKLTHDTPFQVISVTDGHDHYPSTNADENADTVESNDDIERRERLNAVMRQALENPLILFNLAHNLTASTLLIMRLVCHKWKSVASQILICRQCCKMTFEFDEITKRFAQDDLHTNPQDLASLNTILQTSSDFPCTSVEVGFCYYTDETEKEVVTFFELQGGRVTTLIFNMVYGDKRSKQVFIKILTSLTPNLKHLELRTGSLFHFFNDVGGGNRRGLSGQVAVQAVMPNKNESSLSLPSLETFTWFEEPAPSSLPLEILNGAPNLKAIPIFDLDLHLDIVVHAGKIPLVKRLTCKPTMFNVGRELTQFVEGNPSLTFLRFEFGWGWPETHQERLGPFQRLLEANAHSLEHLEMGKLGTDYAQLVLPQFVKLNRLKLNNSGPCEKRVRKHSRCFPPKTNLPWTFPHLQTLDLTTLRVDDEINFNKYFRYLEGPDGDGGRNGDNFFRSVRHVIVNGRISDGWMKMILTNLCPNFNQLTVWSQQVSPHLILKRIFRQWQHLEKIELRVHEPTHGVANLDAALTGLTEKTCASLLDLQDATGSLDTETEERIQKELLKRKPALCDMIYLKELKITPDHTKSRGDPNESDHPIISFVVGKFACDLLSPDFRLVIQFNPKFAHPDLTSKLSSIHPCVRVVHSDATDSDDDYY